MRRKQILGIILIIFSALLIISVISYSTIKYDGDLGETKTINDKCYDRYASEIKGLICEKEVIDEYDLYIMFGIPISTLSLFLSLVYFGFASQGESVK